MKTINLRTDFDELTFLELFYAEPTISKPEDGYWCYEVTDEWGVTLKFGVDTIQQSVQLDVKISGISIVNFSFELVEFIEIFDLSKGQFSFSVSPKDANLDTKVKVELRPKIKIHGATLRTS
jgi:hypothetical protein